MCGYGSPPLSFTDPVDKNSDYYSHENQSKFTYINGTITENHPR